MNKQYTKKTLSVIFAIVLVVSLTVGLMISASAADYTMTTVHDSSINCASGDTVSISSATEMGYFRDYVNASNNTSGVTFDLTQSIALSGSWTPVGGACGVTNNVPNGIGFSGVFNGHSKTISGLSVSATTTGTTNTGYGLFGYVNGGVVGNLTVSGSVTISGSGQDIGGVVGYTNWNLYNITSFVTVSASGCSNVGGVAGAVENKTTTDVNVKYCANNNAVTGSGRVGGVLGASYEGTTNHIYIDRCYNVGDVTSTATTKTYDGGVVGYCCGAISNCYNTGDLTCGSSTAKCYMGGITGILVHYNTLPSSMTNCYSIASYANIWAGYPQYLYASADNSTSVIIGNSYWVVPGSGALGYGQAQYGTWNPVDSVADKMENQLTAALMGSAFTGTAPAALDFTNAYTDLVSGTPSTPTETDDLSMIFLDGTAATDGTGSKTSPYNSLLSAKVALTANRNVIYITGQVTISAATQISSNVTGATIKRSCSYGGDLFLLTANSLQVNKMIIDGNKANYSNASGALIRMDSGSLSVTSNATLRNNSTQTNGGAIHILGGNITMNGHIYDNYAQNGGGVYLSGGNLTVGSTGVISGNACFGNGAGLYVSAGSSYTNSGTINDSIYIEP